LELTTVKAEIFAALREELARFVPPLEARTGTVRDKDDYLVSAPKEAIRRGRKYPETYFAGVIVQKAYVGFYFMPVGAGEQSRIFAPELLGFLKGKSCFHFKRLDGELLAEVGVALDRGFALYRERGWID
jgi:hypothetical protein